MTRVLVVDDDDTLRDSVERDLLRQGYQVDSAASVESALALLTDHHVDVLLTDLRMTGADGIDLIKAARQISSSTQALLMSGFGSARDYQAAIELGAVRVLCKPFTSTELAYAVKLAAECQFGFQGRIHGLSLVDLLQMFHLAHRSVTLTVNLARPDRTGTVTLRDGELVDATLGAATGEAALCELLRSPFGSVGTQALADGAARSITRRFQEVLLDALRQLDEATGPTPEAQDAWTDFDDHDPAAPTATAHADDEDALLTLAATWGRAWSQAIGTPDVVAVGVSLRSGQAVPFRGEVDAAGWAPPILALVESLEATYGERGLIECCDLARGVVVIWDRRAGVAIALGNIGARMASAAVLRATTVAVARAALATDVS